MIKKKKNWVRPQLLPNIEDWPIYKIHQDRRDFVEQIIEEVHDNLMQLPTEQLKQLLARTAYLELIRIKDDPWKVDPADDKPFWKGVRKRLYNMKVGAADMDARRIYSTILAQIVRRYAEEIVGTFRISTFRFARKFLHILFTRLLNAAAGKKFSRLYGTRLKLSDRMIITGPIDTVRELFKKGTIVVVSTHHSNLDSILVGYALDTLVGLPSFSYGAGLNLYNTGYTAYYMNRLGAYRIDRRKKNPIYLETLKVMSKLSIQRGVNNLFFPGGTRSRSGALESKLKLGLLSTTIDAQRSLLQSGSSKKIFIVPVVLNYHFVLEAKFLIDQHLARTGEEAYLKGGKDRSIGLRKSLRFLWNLFSEGNEIILSLGQPMDVIGNPVDADGHSFDKYGNPLHIADYFRTGDTITQNEQRESEYTRHLADHIVNRFHRDNIVLSSHLVAFAAFELLRHYFERTSLYGLLRQPSEDFEFDRGELLEVLGQLRHMLTGLEEAGRIRLSPAAMGAPADILKDGLHHLGTYHVEKALRVNKQGQIVSEDFKLLYFYHNRLDGYALAQQIDWPEVAAESTAETLDL